jgi:hypothetical protein
MQKPNAPVLRWLFEWRGPAWPRLSDDATRSVHADAGAIATASLGLNLPAPVHRFIATLLIRSDRGAVTGGRNRARDHGTTFAVDGRIVLPATNRPVMQGERTRCNH